MHLPAGRVSLQALYSIEKVRQRNRADRFMASAVPSIPHVPSNDSFVPLALGVGTSSRANVSVEGTALNLCRSFLSSFPCPGDSEMTTDEARRKARTQCTLLYCCNQSHKPTETHGRLKWASREKCLIRYPYKRVRIGIFNIVSDPRDALP